MAVIVSKAAALRVAERTGTLMCHQPRENLGADESELVADERLAARHSSEIAIYQVWDRHPAAPASGRVAYLPVGRFFFTGTSRVPVTRMSLAAFIQAFYPGEIRELLARPGFEHPVADLRVDRVSRIE